MKNSRRQADHRPATETTIPRGIKKKQMRHMRRLLGADLNRANKYGWTPVGHALARDQVEAANLLLEQRARICVKDVMGAARHDTSRCLECLLKHKVEVNVILEKTKPLNADDISFGPSGETPLHEARAAPVATLLIKHGVPLNQQEASGRTALHFASMNGFVEVVEVILKAGADPNILDKKNKSALDQVDAPPGKKPKYDAIRDMLRAHGGLAGSEIKNRQQ